MSVVDALVVGDGIVGRLVALRLADHGRTVAIVTAPRTASSPGRASDAAGAMLAIASEAGRRDDDERNATDARERKQGRELWRELVDRLEAGAEALSVRDGVVVVANSVGEADRLELDAIRRAARAASSPVEDVDLDAELPELRPTSAARPFAAIRLPDEGSIDATAAMHALGRALTAAGVTTVDGEVASVEPGTLVLADGSRVEGGVVVLAPGAATALLADPALGLPLVVGGRGVSVVVRTKVAFPCAVRTPNRAFACGIHAVPRDDGSLYLGATNRLSLQGTTERHPMIGELQTLLDGATQELATGLRDAEVVTALVGHRPVTADRFPLVGPTGLDRVHVATGAYRNGVVLAPRLAELLQQQLDGKGELDDHPFSSTRPEPPRPSLDELLDGSGGGLGTFLADLIGARGDGDRLDGAARELLRLGSADPVLQRRLDRILRIAPLGEALPLALDAMLRER